MFGRRFMRMLAAVMALGVALAGAAPAARADALSAWQAYGEKRYAAALAELRPLARAGDAAAQFYLGTAYADGLAVPRNYALAARWSESAA
ncbi:MAG: sel1 repeat family protein, partial [Alphaproteobacteria bacterium]